MTPDFTQDQIDAGRRLFGGPSTFVLGVAKLEQLPEVRGVEIAFAGRSNVGKSSLINALTGVNGLARASNTTPVVVLRFEGDTPEALERIKGVFREQLLALAPNAKLPF